MLQRNNLHDVFGLERSDKIPSIHKLRLLLEYILVVVVRRESSDDGWNSVLINLMFLHVDAVDYFLLCNIDQYGWYLSCEWIFVQLSEDNQHIRYLL